MKWPLLLTVSVVALGYSLDYCVLSLPVLRASRRDKFCACGHSQHALFVSCIDSSSATAAVLGRGKALDNLMLSPLALRASRRDQF